MQYFVTINDVEYELPKKTIAVVEKLDKAAKVDSQKISLKDKFRTVHDCVRDLVGADNAKVILGSDRLEEVDLSEVAIAFQRILNAYDKPLDDYRAEQIDENREKLDRMRLDKIVDVANAVKEYKK